MKLKKTTAGRTN